MSYDIWRTDIGSKKERLQVSELVQLQVSPTEVRKQAELCKERTKRESQKVNLPILFHESDVVAVCNYVVCYFLRYSCCKMAGMFTRAERTPLIMVGWTMTTILKRRQRKTCVLQLVFLSKTHPDIDSCQQGYCLCTTWFSIHCS